ncbi:peptidase family M20/M25/M40 [Nemania sp. FL0031]|nr:peptidase family M20/M25/M40 [Nemania sp. FL0031]
MALSEKVPALPRPRTTAPRSRWTWASALLLYTTAFAAALRTSFNLGRTHLQSRGKCPQVHPLLPDYQTPALRKMEEFIRSDQFRQDAVKRMGGAIWIRTESFDDLGLINEDPRWGNLSVFADYLDETFPEVHSALTLDMVNTHGLFGHYDGNYIWGRGSVDDKNNVIAILESVELLLEADFQPRRSVVLAFGFDEEISGEQGARYIADTLMQEYKDGVAVIIDEGAGIAGFWGTPFGLPGVAEKGYIDVEIVVQTPGGHSSSPTPHTSIGIASELITLIEANPYPSHFHAGNPILDFLECGNRYGHDFPWSLKKYLPWREPSWPGQEDRLALEAAKLGNPIKYLFTTSSAVDVINGGVKVNALPERTRVLVNHRVNVGDKTSEVEDKLTHLARKVASKYNLALQAFNDKPEIPHSITLKTLYSLDPAPVSPTLVNGVTPYAILSGTTRALYGESVIMAPAMMPGNTDSRYYWGLSKHIFRYNPGWDPEVGLGLDGIHTINEKPSMKAHTRAVEWYSLFIRNMDEADLDDDDDDDDDDWDL